jgi:hypothetical protein
MFLERNYQVAQERCRDTLAWAEQERLIRKIRADRTSLRYRYQCWLAWLGARLVRWGSYLQARYADTLIAANAIENSTSPLASQ